MKEWIKFSEQEPKPSEYPIFAANSKHVGWIKRWSDGWPEPYINDEPATHWQPLSVPSPPPKEPRQDEIDAKAFTAHLGLHTIPVAPSTAWHAALAWERSRTKQSP